eukprot:2258260-Prymnesium_polylepis.1
MRSGRVARGCERARSARGSERARSARGFERARTAERDRRLGALQDLALGGEPGAVSDDRHLVCRAGQRQ